MKPRCLLLSLLIAGTLAAADDCTCECDKWQFWLGAEYLCWWMKNSPEPVPLVVTGPAVSNISPLLPGTSTLIGDETVSLGAKSGVRFTAAKFFTDWVGVEGHYLLLPQTTSTQKASSNGAAGSRFLAIPFTDAQTGEHVSTRIANPGEFAGSAIVKIRNDMQTAEGEIFGRVYCIKPVELNAMAGFKWWNFNEKLTFDTNSPNVVPPFDIFKTYDSFKTTNNFYGGLLGLNAAFTWDWFFLEAIGRVSLGLLHSSLDVQGRLVTNSVSDSLQTFPGGYFAQPTNEGGRTKNWFAVLPEANLNLGFQCTENFALEIGYTFLYVSRVLWAGNAIDSTINPSQAPAMSNADSTTLVGPARPKPLFQTESFWIQGVSAGIGFTY